MSDDRQDFADFACSFQDLVAVKGPGLDRYNELTGSPALAGASGCALVQCGLLFKFLAHAPTCVRPPIHEGQAMMNVLHAGAVAGAVVRATECAASGRLPGLGDIVHSFNQTPTRDHVWCVANLEPLQGLDGGQVEDGCQAIKVIARSLAYDHRGTLIETREGLPDRVVDWWLDLPTLVMAYGRAK